MTRYFPLLLLIVVLLPFTACEPTVAQPLATATPAPTLAPTFTPDAAQPMVLVLPGSSEQKTLITGNRHYSDAVKQKGWNVQFYTVHDASADGTDNYLSYVAKQLCSGMAQADGYFWLSMPDDGQTLQQAKEDGQLYDCAAVAASVVPQYWAKYQKLISSAHFGLALANQMKPVRMLQPVLLVRDDILPLAQPRMGGYDDLRGLLNRLRQEHPDMKYLLQADVLQLLELWTQQQGYLALFADAGIYTRADDPDAKPVLLEAIPGIEQFLQDMVEAQAKGLLQTGGVVLSSDGSVKTIAQQAGDENMTPAVALTYSYRLFFGDIGRGPSWKRYTAFFLCNDRSYASDWYEAEYDDMLDQPQNLQELIIPARSRHATEAMQFVQWLYADRRNADAAIYGQEGIDYRLQGERVEILGTAAPEGQIPSWQSWPGYYLFQLAAEQRIHADAPKNTELLFTSPPVKPLAAPWLTLMGQTQAEGKLMAQQTINSRQGTISTLSSWPFDPGSLLNPQSFLQGLRASATDETLQPYLDVLAQARLMASHDGGGAQ